MMKLLRIESKKILTYKVFWILIGLYFLFLALGIMMAEFMINSSINQFNTHMPIPFPHVQLYFFPEIWQNITFFAGIRYVLIFPAIVIIILITNEFTFKTIRQNIVNGMSKEEFLVSKLEIILILSVVITVLIGLATILLGVFNSDERSFSMIFGQSLFLLGFFVEIFSFLMFAFFFGFIFRNTGLAIALFTLYVLIVEPVLYFIMKIPSLHLKGINTYLPVNSVIRVVEYPAIPFLKKTMGFTLQDHVSLLTCLVPLAYSAVMIAVVFRVMKKKDL